MYGLRWLVATQFFSASEIRELESWPVEVGRDELVRYFQLSVDDVEWVNRTTRGAPNKLGLGLQLASLPWLGFIPAEVRAAPPPAVARVATQLGVEADALAHYGRREQTRSDHLRLVAKRLRWRTAEMPVSRLTWLHRGATSYSPSAIRAEVDKVCSCVAWTWTPWTCR